MKKWFLLVANSRWRRLTGFYIFLKVNAGWITAVSHVRHTGTPVLVRPHRHEVRVRWSQYISVLCTYTCDCVSLTECVSKEWSAVNFRVHLTLCLNLLITNIIKSKEWNGILVWSTNGKFNEFLLKTRIEQFIGDLIFFLLLYGISFCGIHIELSANWIHKSI